MSEKNFHPPPGQNTDPDHVEPSMSGNDYPPPGQHTITDFRSAEQDHAEPKDYPPPGQHTITYSRAEQDHVEPSMPRQNIPLGKQTMPQARQYIPPGQQPTAPQMGQAQPMHQQKYVVGGQAMPQQQQYVQQVPGQHNQQQQHYIERPMGGQSPAPFLNTPLQPWTTELFDCAHDMENAVITAFFPCITFGQIAEITDQGMSTCTGAGLIYGLLLYFTGLHWIYSWMYRTRMRTANSLPEEPCHDCLVHAFCDPCALCQEYRELQNRGFNMQLGWIGNTQLQAQKEAVAGVPPPGQGMTR